MLEQESIKNEINVPVKMRDGTILYADVYRPDTEKKYPAIVSRLPYNKSLSLPINSGYMNPQRFVREGYSVVIQDCRGTGVSEGKTRLWECEREDGYDTIEWTAVQPWCDGNVGMYGASYFGYTQWMAAAARPPHLKTICPAESAPSARDYPMSGQGSVFGLQGHISWYLRMCMLSLINSKLPPVEIKTMLDRLTCMLDNINEQSEYLPVTDSPGAKTGEELGMEPSISEFIINMKNDDYWRNINTVADYEDINIPVFHISGWYDQFCSNVLASFRGMKEKSGSEEARKNQKLLMGPWFHGTALTSNVGSLDFGLASAGPSIDVTGMHIKWFDYWLKGIDNGIMNEPVRIFVMGDNSWRDEKDWPLPDTEYTRYYFHSDGRANSRNGNGVLSTTTPGKEPDDVFLYDPRNPVPYKWDIPASGYGMFAVQEQEEVEKRADVLVYTSEILEKDLEITGNIEIRLWAVSSAVDTDFTGKLVDVWPDGKAYNLTDGIVRARYRNSTKKPEFIEPGKVYEYSIELQPTSNVFKAGHRVRVQISSSNFPKYDRNLNTGNKIGQDDKIEIAVQTILHNEDYPSHIILPLISR